MGQTDDGVGLDADEAAGLPDAVALGQVVEHGEGCLRGESAAVQWRALALGEAGAAGVAVELAVLPGLAVAAADREVAGAAPAVERAVGVLAAEAREVVHGLSRPGRPGPEEIRGWERMTSLILRRIPHNGSTRLRHHPFSEQQEIVRRVSMLLELADTIEQRAKSALQHVERLTQSVLARAFRGELVPTEAELARREGRSYEPATELLARLRSSTNGETKRPRARKSSKRTPAPDGNLLDFKDG